MFHGHKVIDVHGHHSTPAQFRAYAYNMIALRTPAGSSLSIPEKAMEEAQARHLGMMDDRNVDVQFISPRPVAMMHWEMPHLVEHWTEVTNNVIHQTCQMYPERFVGVAQLPQVGIDYSLSTEGCLPEFERAIGLGFVAATVNPDPGGDRRAPGMNDPYWFPLYRKSVELGAPLIVHASISRDPRITIIPHSYQYNFMTEQALATQLLENSDVFDRFPDLKILVCHCGGALSRFIPRAESSGVAGGGQVGIGGQSAPAHENEQKTWPNNLFFDTCAYDKDYLATAMKHKGIDQMCFGTESPGSGTGVLNPLTGKPADDMLPVIDLIEFLDDADKRKLVYDNPLKVFSLFKG